MSTSCSARRRDAAGTLFVIVSGLTVLLACGQNEIVKSGTSKSTTTISRGQPIPVGLDREREANAIWMIMPVTVTDDKGRPSEFWGLFACYRGPSDEWPNVPAPNCKLAKMEGSPTELNWPGGPSVVDGQLQGK